MTTPTTSRPPGEPYLALPPGGAGPGVLVLHAWWGLNDTFRAVCDRLAAAGCVALAPDLYAGAVAATIDEAEALMTADSRDFAGTRALVEGAVATLRGHPGVRGDGVGAVGFSMGASWAMLLATERPADLAAVVIFYGSGEGDFGRARAAFLGHYAEGDEWEPDEQVRQLEEDIRAAGREVAFHRYPGARHWFFEPDRPEHDPAAADLAWERTLAFLHRHLIAT
jgi:carboxymethylenebutenolidase